ncbi:MAG: AAA family ATPase [Lentisphaeria bacterium]|nr:AAA family ATPase [Lentisphaeria bacterium]
MSAIDEFKDKLQTYFDAGTPIICIDSFDRYSVIDTLNGEFGREYEIVQYRNKGFLTFAKDGVTLPDLDSTPADLPRALKYYVNYRDRKDNSSGSKPGILILNEIQPLLDQMECWLKLQEYAQNIQEFNDGLRKDRSCDVRIILLCSRFALPPELEPFVTLLHFPAPDRDEIQKILLDFLTVRGEEPKDIDADFYEVVKALQGLTAFEIKGILAKAHANGPMIGKDGLDFINQEKQQIVRKSGLLEMIRVRESERLVGMSALREYIQSYKAVFEHIDLAERHQVSVPNGIMVFGMPGCGKSLSAKFAAQTYNMPLLRLDVGKMLGKFIGESESNLRRAIHAAEAAAPCVLWIDEIEKAFAGVGENSGAGDVTTRMFGYFLTWMQEKESAIFIVATANKIEKLPPEFLRKGRFDEIFKVDFPTRKERREILMSHVLSRCPEVDDIDWNAVLAAFPADKRDKYSGADIEAVVKDAFRNVFIENLESHGTRESSYRRIATKDLVKSAKEVVISYDKERYADLEKSFKKLEARNASV